MDGRGRGRGRRRWTDLKQRLGLKGMGWCGAAWSPSSSTLTMMDVDQTLPNVGPTPRVSGMNLAMALAAERNSRAADAGPTEGGDVKSLMRLFQETDGADWKSRKKENPRDCDWVCCVCMERSKGAAFIPCGHAFCRVCSRELWINRGSCAICNRPISEVLDIY